MSSLLLEVQLLVSLRRLSLNFSQLYLIPNSRSCHRENSNSRWKQINSGRCRSLSVWTLFSCVCVLSRCVLLSINHTLATLITVHGSWDEWTPWSLCSSTCGRGYRDRTRSCKKPLFGGSDCEGPEKQTKFCNIAVCPGDLWVFKYRLSHTHLMSFIKQHN